MEKPIPVHDAGKQHQANRVSIVCYVAVFPRNGSAWSHRPTCLDFYEMELITLLTSTSTAKKVLMLNCSFKDHYIVIFNGGWSQPDRLVVKWFYITSVG